MSAEEPITAGRARLALVLAQSKILQMQTAYEAAIAEFVEKAEACARGLDAMAPSRGDESTAFTIYYRDADKQHRAFECHAASLEELRHVLRAFPDITIASIDRGWPAHAWPVSP